LQTLLCRENQVVLTCDRFPQDIENCLYKEFISLLKRGIMADLWEAGKSNGEK